VISKDDAQFLVDAANKHGMRGEKIIAIQLPINSTQNITDTIFYVSQSKQLRGSSNFIREVCLCNKTDRIFRL